MNQFLFLYPIKEYFDNEIGKAPLLVNTRFRKKYFNILNECINERYRKNNFIVNWALFNGHNISPEIEIRNLDKLVYADIDFKTHTTKQPDGKYLYSDNDFMLNQIDLNQIEHFRVAGFHIWDCVEKFAENAHKRGLNVMIDEDLTEFLFSMIRFGPKFKTDVFPSYNPRIRFSKRNMKYIGMSFDTWFDARKGKPWFFQDYSQ